eukprot:6475509-Amphidinium_carterae.1
MEASNTNMRPSARFSSKKEKLTKQTRARQQESASELMKNYTTRENKPWKRKTLEVAVAVLPSAGASVQAPSHQPPDGVMCPALPVPCGAEQTPAVVPEPPSVHDLLEQACVAAKSLSSILEQVRDKFAPDFRAGGVRKALRVSKSSIDAHAVQLLAEDLGGGLDVVTPGAFLAHIVASDSKAARGIVQAQSPGQRLSVLAASCHRAGLPEKRDHFRALAARHDQSHMASAAPVVAPVVQPTSAGPPTPPPVALVDRVSLLEEWTEQFQPFDSVTCLQEIS